MYKQQNQHCYKFGAGCDNLELPSVGGFGTSSTKSDYFTGGTRLIAEGDKECVLIDRNKGIPRWQKQCYNKQFCLGSRQPWGVTDNGYVACFKDPVDCKKWENKKKIDPVRKSWDCGCDDKALSESNPKPNQDMVKVLWVEMMPREKALQKGLRFFK